MIGLSLESNELYAVSGGEDAFATVFKVLACRFAVLHCACYPLLPAMEAALLCTPTRKSQWESSAGLKWKMIRCGV